MAEPSLKDIYHAYIACLNRQDWPNLGQFVGEAVRHNGRRLGLSGYRAMLEQDFRDIPDLYFNIALLICDPPFVASRLRFECTPTGHVPWAGREREKSFLHRERVLRISRRQNCRRLVRDRQGGDRSPTWPGRTGLLTGEGSQARRFHQTQFSRRKRKKGCYGSELTATGRSARCRDDRCDRRAPAQASRIPSASSLSASASRFPDPVWDCRSRTTLSST